MSLGDGGQAQYILHDLESFWELKIIDSTPSKSFNLEAKLARTAQKRLKC